MLSKTNILKTTSPITLLDTPIENLLATPSNSTCSTPIFTPLTRHIKLNLNKKIKNNPGPTQLLEELHAHYENNQLCHLIEKSASLIKLPFSETVKAIEKAEKVNCLWLLAYAINGGSEANDDITCIINFLIMLINSNHEMVISKLVKAPETGKKKGINGAWLLASALADSVSNEITTSVDIATIITSLIEVNHEVLLDALGNAPIEGKDKGKNGYWLLCEALRDAIETKKLEQINTVANLIIKLFEINHEKLLFALEDAPKEDNGTEIKGYWVLCDALRNAIEKNNLNHIEKLANIILKLIKHRPEEMSSLLSSLNNFNKSDHVEENCFFAMKNLIELSKDNSTTPEVLTHKKTCNEQTKHADNDKKIYIKKLHNILDEMLLYATQLQRNKRPKDANVFIILSAELRFSVNSYIQDNRIDGKKWQQLVANCKNHILYAKLDNHQTNILFRFIKQIIVFLGRLLILPPYLENKFRSGNCRFFNNSTNRRQLTDQFSQCLERDFPFDMH